MESHLKLRISRIFKSPMSSCKSRKNVTDVVVEKPVFLPENRQHHQLIELFSPRSRPFPSICRPRRPETSQTQDSTLLRRRLLPTTKLPEEKSALSASPYDFHGPPATPISPLPSRFSLRGPSPKVKGGSTKGRKKHRAASQFKTSDSRSYYNSVFSSEEEDDNTTLFSSRSLSSDSSGCFQRKNASGGESRSRKKERRVKGSFAVVKRSSDPYSDFRDSMVEMIVERRIFAAEDLDDLLRCFLSLNSCHHHKVIIQAFTEVGDTLFSNNRP